MKKLYLLAFAAMGIFAIACNSNSSETQNLPKERVFAPERQGWTSEWDDYKYVYPRFPLFGDVDSLKAIFPEGYYYTYKFNQKGDLISERRYSADETEAYYEEILTYDANGNLVNEVIIEDGIMKADQKYEYDAENRMTHETGYYYGFDIDLLHLYDDFGNEIEYRNTLPDEFKMINTYNSENKLIEENAYSLDGKEHRLKRSYEYDGNGNLIKETLWATRTSNIIRIDEYTYDESNIKTEQTICHYDDNGMISSKSISRYNKDGDNTADEYYEGLENTLDRKYTYAFDTYGNLIEEKRFDNNNQLTKHTTYHITYDSHGNRLTHESHTHIDKSSYYLGDQVQYEIYYRQ